MSVEIDSEGETPAEEASDRLQSRQHREGRGKDRKRQKKDGTGASPGPGRELAATMLEGASLAEKSERDTRANGMGVARGVDQPHIYFEGSFKNNKCHGFCK